MRRSIPAFQAASGCGSACHDRTLLLRRRADRNGYRRGLREPVRKYDLSLLSYSITSNHLHLVVFSDYAAHLNPLTVFISFVFFAFFRGQKNRS